MSPTNPRNSPFRVDPRWSHPPRRRFHPLLVHPLFGRGVDEWNWTKKEFCRWWCSAKETVPFKGGETLFLGEYDNKRAPPPYRVFDANFAHDAISPNLSKYVQTKYSISTYIRRNDDDTTLSWLRWDSANSVEKCNDSDSDGSVNSGGNISFPSRMRGGRSMEQEISLGSVEAPIRQGVMR